MYMLGRQQRQLLISGDSPYSSPYATIDAENVSISSQTDSKDRFRVNTPRETAIIGRSLAWMSVYMLTIPHRRDSIT